MYALSVFRLYTLFFLCFYNSEYCALPLDHTVRSSIYQQKNATKFIDKSMNLVALYSKIEWSL